MLRILCKAAGNGGGGGRGRSDDTRRYDRDRQEWRDSKETCQCGRPKWADALSCETCWNRNYDPSDRR